MAEYTLKARLIADASSLEKGFAKAQASLRTLSDKVGAVGSTLSGIGRSLLPVTAGFAGMGAAAVKTTVDFTKLYESTMIVFEKMLGGKDAANGLYDSLLKTAKASTFSQETFLRCGKQLVGMGLSAQDTTKYMQAVSDAVSGFGGTSANIEQVAEAFAKISTTGKIYTEDINQLANNGIDAMRILANSYGVTTDEMRSMVSDGAVPAKDALDRLADGIENGTDGVNGATQAMAGLAAAMKGKTLTGALDSLNTGFRSFSQNLTGINPALKETDAGYAESKARLDQLTAAISTVAGLLPQLSTLFSGVTDAIGTMLDKLVGTNSVYDEAAGKWENVGGLLGTIQDKLNNTDPEKLKTLGSIIAGLAAGGPILMAVGGGVSKLSSATGLLSGAVGSLKSPLGSFTDGLKTLGKETPNIKKSIGDLGEGFGFFKEYVGLSFSETMPILSGGLQDVSSKLSGGKSAISTVLGEMGSNFKAAGSSMFGGFANTAKKIIPNSIQTLGSDIGGAFSAVLPNISTGLSGLGQSISKFGPMFLSSFGSLFKFGAIAGLVVAGFGLLQQNFGDQINSVLQTVREKGPLVIQEFLTGMYDKLPLLMQLGTSLITSLLDTITVMLPSIISAGVQIVSNLVGGIANSLPAIIPAALNMIITLATSLLGNIGQIIDAGIQLLIGLVNGLIAAIPQLIDAIPTIIKSLLTGIIQNLPTIIKAGIELTVAIGVGLIKAIPDLVGMLPEIFTAIFDAFKEVDWLDLGKNIIKGIIEGLGAMLGALWDAVKGIGQSILDWFKAPDALDVNSPSKRMRDEVGMMIPAGIGVGIQDGMPALRSILKKETASLTREARISPVALSTEEKSVIATPSVVSPNPVSLSAGTMEDISDIQKTALTIGSINADLGNTLLADTTAYTAASQNQWSQMETGITDSAGKMNAQVSAAYSAFSMGYQTQTVTLKNNVLSNWTLMRNMVVQIAKEMGVQATSLFNQLAASVIAIMSALPPKMRTIGSSAMGELQTGINASRGGPLNEASSLVNDLLNVFIEGLGIHSPSKAMEWIGEMMAAGLIKGLSSEQIDKFTLSIIDKMQNSFTNGSLDVGKVVDRLGDNVPELVAKLGVDPSQAQALAYPLIGTLGELTSYFGLRPASDTNGIGSTNHGGIDLAASTGTPIAALASGLVTIAGWYGGYGNAVQIDHGNGMSSLYGHMSSVGVSVGQQVGTGQTIGAVGSTGNSTGPHLHLSMFQDGVAVDPLPYIQGGQMMGNTLASALMAAYNMRKYGLGSDNNGAGGGLDNWLMQALAITGQGMNNLSALRYIAMMESGGDPNAINLWDSNAAAGHPSKGLMQTIDSTFGAYALPGMNDIWNPVHNTVAAIRYMIDRYGGIGNHPGLGSGGYVGYAIGTSCVPQDMLAMIHEGEGIIPADEMKELNRLMNPVNPYRNSGGPVLPNLGISFAETNGQTIGKNISGGFRSGFDTLFSSIMKTAERSMNLSGTSEWFDDAAYGLDKGSRRQVPDIKVEVTSVMDGRKVGYGSARYVNEKNTFDEKRRNRIGGIV